MANKNIQQGAKLPDWLQDLTPVVMDFIRDNPHSPFALILSALVGFIFPNGKAEFPPVPGDIAPELQQKAGRKLDPDYAAKAYLDALGDIDHPAHEINVRYRGSDKDVILTRQNLVVDPQTGFKGATYIDKGGHSITFFGGMDSIKGFDVKDAATIAQGVLHRINNQTGPAQDLYLDAVRSSNSTEIVGYSMGGMLANDMAARLHAEATTLGDIGLPDVKDGTGKSMYTAEHIQNIHENVVALKLPNDPYFAHAGKVHGQIKMLPEVSGQAVLDALNDPGNKISLPNNFNAQSGMAHHHLMAYELASDKLIKEQEIAAAPGTTQILTKPLVAGMGGTSGS
ncbi:MAG: hypothetical protein WBK55_08905 [Alphaproteobacteria bacterium]